MNDQTNRNRTQRNERDTHDEHINDNYNRNVDKNFKKALWSIQTSIASFTKFPFYVL